MLKSVSLVLLVAVGGCSKKDDKPAPAAQPTTVVKKDPAAARKMIEGGAVIVDVRTPEEYDGGHLERATNVPIQDFAQRIAEVDKLVAGDKAKPVVVYCGSGGRASKAKAQLEAAGYTNVVNGGGYDDLQP